MNVNEARSPKACGCVRACVPEEPERVEAAVARAVNPTGRDNGNNAIGASAQGIGARGPSRCA